MGTSPSPLDLDRIGHGLRAAFPSLGGIAPVRLLGGEFRSVAVETAGGVVFRIARNAEAMAGHRREIRLLPALQRRVPVGVPEPRWHAGPSLLFPFGVVGYPKLPGVSLEPRLLGTIGETDIATEIALFLVALHRLPSDVTEGIGLPDPAQRWGDLEALRAQVLPPLRAALSAAEHGMVARWWDDVLTDPAMRSYRPCLVHGDLWYENVLVDAAARTVTGVIDWEWASIGDPAQDFATQMHLGRRFATAVVTAYLRARGVLDAGFAHRMRRLWELREFEGIGFAVRHDDPLEFADAIRKLRRGPLLGPGVHH